MNWRLLSLYCPSPRPFLSFYACVWHQPRHTHARRSGHRHVFTVLFDLTVMHPRPRPKWIWISRVTENRQTALRFCPRMFYCPARCLRDACYFYILLRHRASPIALVSLESRKINCRTAYNLPGNHPINSWYNCRTFINIIIIGSSGRSLNIIITLD